MSDSLNYSFKLFVQNGLFIKEAKDCLYEWIIESFTQ